MPQAPLTEPELIRLFMRAKDLDAVCGTLQLEGMSDAHRQALRDVAAVAYDRLHHRELGNKLHFATGWVELFHQAVHELHVFLRAVYGLYG